MVADIIESGFLLPPIIAMKTFLRRLSTNEAIQTDLHVARSEYEHRSRNAAAAYLMKSFGNFENDAEHVLQSYFSNCSITMSCEGLVKAASVWQTKVNRSSQAKVSLCRTSKTNQRL